MHDYVEGVGLVILPQSSHVVWLRCVGVGCDPYQLEVSVGQVVENVAETEPIVVTLAIGLEQGKLCGQES